MSRPEQAVILCGGLGMRLRPITDNLPKPMAPVNGRPFLAYLLQQLKEQGIQRVLMLTGYRGEMIHEFFGNGESFGVDICYSHGPVEWETGRRIFEARTELDSAFLLLYSDNYVPVNLEELYAFHAGSVLQNALKVPRGALHVGTVTADHQPARPVVSSRGRKNGIF